MGTILWLQIVFPSFGKHLSVWSDMYLTVIIWLTNCLPHWTHKLLGGRNNACFCSLLPPQCLVHSGHSVTICWMKKRMNECSWLCCSHLCYKNYHPKTGCTQSSACFSPLLPGEPVKHRNALFSSILLTSSHQHLWTITKDTKSFMCASEKSV